MTRFYTFFGICLLMLTAAGSFTEVCGQTKETYTGTVISFGSRLNTRTTTGTFTININNTTSDEQAQRYLGILAEGGQDNLRDSINNEDLGRFSVGGNVGVPINVVRESVVDGRRRIFIVFERYTQFAEARGGYRSLDYPFGVIELYLDERTGKGEGTYIAAAQIRWKQDKKTNQYQVEIENFATYPARLLGVTLRGSKNRAQQ